MTHRRPRPSLPILVAALLAAVGCGDGGGSNAQPAPRVLTCDGVFSTDGIGSTSAALRAGDEPAAVTLSTCPLDAQRNVVIGGAGGCGPNVIVDRDFVALHHTQLGKITIESGGKLVFPDLGDPEATGPDTLAMETTGILIKSGGMLRVGLADCPIGFHPDAHVTITFTGDRDLRCTPSAGCDDGSVKGIEVQAGGILDMHGAKGVPEPDPAAGPPGVSWTVLSASAGPHTSRPAELHLAADVTQGQRPWEKGDWIVVGTSSFSPFESEFVEIAAVRADGAGGSIVRTRQALHYVHFGSEPPTPSQRCMVDGTLQAVACGSLTDCTAPCTSAPSALNYNDPASRNFGIDERAEVGLISRSITLSATTPEAPPPNESPLRSDPSLHWGGEVRILGSSAAPPRVAIVGVELEKFGKDQLGSYPLHLHMVGDAQQKPTFAANSIHHSFNKCIAVHMSSNLTFKDNVCARAVGHLFYEEHGSEEHVRFERNLGLGAMSNSFDIHKARTVGPAAHDIPRGELIRDHWWAGDHLARREGYHYDGFNIPNTDNQRNPTHGKCQVADGTGGFGRALEPYSPGHPKGCQPGEFYTEPASGFWITNPTTELIGNAIGGCQGVGRGVWWVTPPKAIDVNGTSRDLKFSPLGTFFDNRAHACYAGFYGEEEYSVVSTVLVPHKDGTSTGQPIIAQLDGMTATRNRFRGVWLRPTWFVVQDGRFATSRENVSLVTSGGIDGNAPGVWALLQDSVIAGVSANNVDRFGPCPNDNHFGPHTGGPFGCIDHVPPTVKVCAPGSAADRVGKTCTVPDDCCEDAGKNCPDACSAPSADEVGLGYPPPSWNMFGYMLYDGPVRVFDDRFVNFRKDVTSLLTETDRKFLREYEAGHIIATAQRCVGGEKEGTPCNLDSDCPGSTCRKAPFVYEGDAALGWFQSNQSSYPTGTVIRGLSWENTDLRHQIYTDKVSLNLEFNDGDKNTAVIDEDGTLTGYGVGDPRHGHTNPGHINPISLNNLPFNATSNSVDECFSRGQQNDNVEGRDSSLISAGSMGTLEFSTLYPWKDMTDDKPPTPIPFPGPDGDVSHTQFITFTRDDVSRGRDATSFHPAMTLHSRDGRGIWEPKVTSGFGYTASAAPAPNFPASTGRAGIASIIDVGVADVVKPDLSADNPFFIRLGICYTDADGKHPQDPSRFSITRGYKSYTGGFVDPNDPELLKYWSPSACNNIDSLNTANITGPTCPGPRERRLPMPAAGGCPSGSTPSSDGRSCVFPTDNLDRVDDPSRMRNPDGTPDLETFFYDRTTGMLFLWVAQDEPNPLAPSPLGSCTGDKASDHPACPDVAAGETYYACPAKGCHVYVIKLDDPSYTPGPSKCQPYETYTGGPFAPQNELVLYGTMNPVEPVLAFDKENDPFHTPSEATDPRCQLTASAPDSSTATARSVPAGDAGDSAATSAGGHTSVAAPPAPDAAGQPSADRASPTDATDAAMPSLSDPPPTPTPTPRASD